MDQIKISEYLEKLKQDESWEPDENKRARVIARLTAIIMEY